MTDRDAQLVAAARTGDADAQAALYRAHVGRVRAYLARRGFTAAEADDLAQEVFVRVFRSLATFDSDRGRFRSWLGAITANVARRAWGRRQPPRALDPELAEEMFAVHDNPGTGAEAREEMDAVQGCVDELSPELARMVRLRYVDGMTMRGIAADTGTPESTVRLRLEEGRRAVEACLKRKGVVE